MKFIGALVFAAAFVALAPGARSGRAEAPAGHFLAMAGTVQDSAARLLWQAEAPDGTYDWADAAAYCAALDLNGKGWRLPSVKELLSLVDETSAMPAIDATAFPGTALDYYWTSSPVTGLAENAWAVSFAYGFDGFFDVATLEHVRCVR